MARRRRSAATSSTCCGALVAVGLVFLHTAVIFGAGEFPVKAPTEHLAVTVVLAFGGMPLLFLISGTGPGTRCAPAPPGHSPANACAASACRSWPGSSP